MNAKQHKPSGKRAESKDESRQRILAAAADMLREEGGGSFSVADVMARAGLTHGAFYSHFPDKDALIEAAFRAAFNYRESWLAAAEGAPAHERVPRLLEGYLNAKHRDRPAAGCAFAACAQEFAHGTAAQRGAFADEIETTLSRLTALLAGKDGNTDTAACESEVIGLLSLCVGAMSLARAVEDPALSNRILEAALNYGRRQAA
ncbi:TetR/AcrR family transcriptional regulator [Tepidicaulis sp.]|uniref:TetR/AcrR family transcriptional regulator n=1 Tax=Tepidicaulis sp. TaxID=1920809 RepID=UPI003B58C0F6